MKTIAQISWLRRINLLLFVSAIFCLPFWLFIVPRILTFFFLSSVIVSIVEKQKFRFRWSYLFLVLLYILYLLSVNWSDHVDRANFGLEIKLSLIIFPVIFSFMSFSRIFECLVFIPFSFLMSSKSCIPSLLS